ncbi:MAG TPA: bifunctional phosphoribosylaminoimidazolecarboxamide formyltransferase/IMP cyclohydrolase [Pyrinomonadaceae bacterium]|nr:bifunctional phosphoribosylaminoimidazolecarboxamide formyltransferase/IMP cyclohydrolase [Pyrinomonadaceae bacterium]
MKPIKRALVSVSDKSGIVDFVRELKSLNVEIISTGGTAKGLRDAGIEVRDISDVTGFPEMMDGRVKTLHPRVHGGLLALRDNPEHVAAMQEHGIEPIDMVVVNLYPFAATIAREGVTREEAIEQIDIGGPAMIRSAAKNANDVAVVVDPAQYPAVIEELRNNNLSLSSPTLRRLATEAFRKTAQYDAMVSSWLAAEIGDELPSQITSTLTKISDLRYGENPHQRAALYQTLSGGGLANAAILFGKEMSFNNYVDADAAWQLVNDFHDTACAIIKHTNPAGVGLGETTAAAYVKALATDPISAFGGIVAFNRRVDPVAAQEVTKIFTEVVIAPDYDAAALELLQTKKNLRVIRIAQTRQNDELELRQISGGMLVQTKDVHELRREDLKVVTKRAPTDEEIRALLFAWTVCKHTKSNAIVYARADQTVGVGAGQMSRVDSVKIGAMRAQLPVAGSVLASDAFFPFRDGLDEAARHGITAVIQPGGSVRDEEVIAAADEHGLAMVFTGVRHFKH